LTEVLITHRSYVKETFMGSSSVELEEVLTDLIKQIPAGVDPLLDSFRASDHGDSSYSTGINRTVRAFELYKELAASGRSFLDWGCRHALDSCLIRTLNPTAKIVGCDITDDMVGVTQRYADMSYSTLTHPWLLPFADGQFDRVVSSGVLEHAPITGSSLLELNRVIAPDGYLIITFLPNSKSYTEFLLRSIFKRGHRRRYSKALIKRLLLDHGFEPVKVGYHQFMPSLITGHEKIKSSWLSKAIRRLFALDPYVEHVWPFRMFDANLYAIGQKRTYM
jgi:ubiquinone/menaquinone biosynthesis C-methylase UbiE